MQFQAGVSYDQLHYPANGEFAPISSDETTAEEVSPKAGFIWTPGRNTVFRFAYTRSLGGFSFDNSVRLVPSQLAGFTQSYRSIVPESVAGPIPGSKFETFSAALDHKFSRSTYVGVAGEILNSDATRGVGAFTNIGELNFENAAAASSGPRTTSAAGTGMPLSLRI